MVSRYKGPKNELPQRTVPGSASLASFAFSIFAVKSEIKSSHISSFAVHISQGKEEKKKDIGEQVEEKNVI